MTILLVALVLTVIVALFCYRTLDFDVAGSIIAGVLGAGALALVIAGAIYAGQLF
jgi:hypothetical protein